MYRLVSGLLASLFLAGCNSGGSDDQFAKNRVDSICPVNMECGFMSVPKSYADETGEQVNIHYGVHKAQDPANRIGILVFNFGGPSAAAVGGVGLMINNYWIPQDILNRFDIVGIDPRGTGQSAFASELTECAVAESEGDGDCTATFTQVAPFLGSNTVVKDIDRLRAMLGEEKLNFLGYSYGTRLGSLYAKMFPERVRAIVLDSPMSPTDANNVEIRIGNAAGYEKIAGFRLEYDKKPNRKVHYQTIVDTLFSGNSYQAIDGALTFKQGSSALNLTVARESSGDWSDISPGLINLLDKYMAAELKEALSLKLASGYNKHYSGSEDDLRGNALFKAVVCTDERTHLSDSEIDTSDDRYKAESSLYGMLTYVQTAELCKGWSALRDPIPAITEKPLGLGDKQILIIGGQYDPATPYTWAEAMAASFGSSASLVTVDNYVDHGFSYSGIGCVDQSTTAYLLDPTQNIADNTCDVSSVSAKKFAVTPDTPHPAKDVIGW
ncbi:alpha/beta hydrolase [Photobacterium lipolyticum]|nr:alpha/beta hydrolase [Photobacterium lipolyticum]